ncbi:hypothetical protein BpHYR1_017920 [Brachionus plicatilis]|uniref:Uncharacterized protein n=1 Tax=Brachionus plicatilis TaxID=10195 RepID=A0A3M7SWV1_BRAPC|nr:hypothetical protein BpHYR1_017920 [Brachionus plicatilis]
MYADTLGYWLDEVSHLEIVYVSRVCVFLQVAFLAVCLEKPKLGNKRQQLERPVDYRDPIFSVLLSRY